MLTIEEISLIKIYAKNTKQDTITNLENAYTLNDDIEIKDFIEQIIRKLTAMNDTDFSQINFNFALDTEEIIP